MKDYIYSNDSGYTVTQADSISEVRAKLMRKKILSNTKPKRLWWDVKWDRGFGSLTYVGSPIIEWTWTTYTDKPRKPLATYYVNPNGMLGKKLGKKYGY